MKMRTIIGMIILLISSNLLAQNKNEIEQFKKQGIGIEIPEHKHSYSFKNQSINEIQFVFSSFFIFKKIQSYLI